MIQEFIKRSKTARPKELVERDIRELKKLNNIINKYKRTKRELYLTEGSNILQASTNLFDLDDELMRLFIKAHIDDDNISFLTDMFNNLNGEQND